ncbi:MAG: GIN domain-containing protein [Legionellales bacterium]
MLKYCCTMIVFVFLITGCAHHRAKAPAPVMVHAMQYRSVTNFNQIDVHGPLNINLHTGYKKPQVLLSGDARDLAQVQVVVTDNTLYVTLGNGYPHYGAVNVDIRSRFLNSLHYVGAGAIRGSQLNTSLLNLVLVNKGTTNLSGHIGLRQLDVNDAGLTQISGISSPYLQIHMKGRGKVQLTGVANIAQLKMDGDGLFSLYWVKSDKLTISARRSAKIQLAGAVNRLDLELWGHAHFKGRYLRAQRSFVKTHGNAVAEVSSVAHQSTLATDASDVYYYNLSDTRADFMAFNGSVLDMREWDQPELRDFTLYNKQFP